MYRHNHAHERVDRFQFLTHEPERDIVETRTAVLLRNADTEQVELRHLAQHGRLELLFLVPLLDKWRDLFLRKFTYRLHQRLVIFGQFKIDHFTTLFISVLKMTGHLTQVETPMSKRRCFAILAPCRKKAAGTTLLLWDWCRCLACWTRKPILKRRLPASRMQPNAARR